MAKDPINAVSDDLLLGLSEIQRYILKRWKIEISRQAIAHWINFGLRWQPPMHPDANLVVEDGVRIRLRSDKLADRICSTKQCVDAFLRRSSKL